MFQNWTFGRRLAGGFGLAGFTLLAISVVSYVNIASLIETDHWVEHTHLVRTNLAELLMQLTNAETGQRGYLLMGDDTYLAPYQGALGNVRKSFEDLRGLTVDSPQQEKRLDEIGRLIDNKLSELKRTIDTRRADGFDAALKIVATDVGKLDMDKIRGLVAEADQEPRPTC